MKFLVFFAIGLAVANARLVRRDAPTVFEDIEKNAQQFGKTFSEQLNALVNSKNAQDVQKSLKEGSETLVKQLTDFSNSIQNVAKDATGKAKEALESTRVNLEKTAEELRRAHPEVEQQATALRDKLTAAVQSVSQETQKLAKEVAANVEETNQKLAPQVKQAYDDFVKQAEQVQKKLHEAASSKQ